MNKLFNKRSKLLFILTIFELIMSTWYLTYFNYLDRLSYYDNVNTNKADLALLLQNMFTSTWWGLLILIIALSSIFSLIAFIYRDEKFQLISTLLWFILLILAIDIKDTFTNNLSTLCIIIPIIIINLIAFIKQKNILN